MRTDQTSTDYRQRPVRLRNRVTMEPAPLGSRLGGEIASVARALWQRKHWIALTTLLALMTAVTYLVLATPRYFASAQILIDPRAKRVIEGAVVPGGFGTSAIGADTLLIDSQVELVLSNTVLSRAATALQLDQDPEFQFQRGPGMRIKMRNWLGQYREGFTPEVAPSMNGLDTAVWRLRDKHLTVRRLGNTYVLSVSVFSENADKAARIANAIAASYLNDQATAAADTTKGATSMLLGRIDELRQRVESAERAVEDYRARSGLLGTAGGLVSEQQLQSMNEKLSVARAQTALAKARYDQVKSLTPTAAGLSAQSDALRSNVIANLRANLARLDRRDAVIQQTLGPRHPDAAGNQAERRSILALIGDELQRVKSNAQAEYELALANERSLEGEMKGLESRTSTNNQALVKLRELQREAQAARQIYETFLSRAKETREQEDLSRESSRIISPASVPAFAASPPTALVLAGSLLGGLGLGSLLAWLGHILSIRPNVDPQRAAGRIARVARPSTSAAPLADSPETSVARTTPPQPQPQPEPAPAPQPTLRPFPARPILVANREDAPRTYLETKATSSAPAARTRETSSVRRVATERPAEPVEDLAVEPAEVSVVIPQRPAASRPATTGQLQATNEPKAVVMSPAAQRPLHAVPKITTPRIIPEHVLPVLMPTVISSGKDRATPSVVSFSDHISAVDTTVRDGDVGYRYAIDRLLHVLGPKTGQSVIALTAARSGVGASGTALSLAYRAAIRGRSTLLIDAAPSAELSIIFANEIELRRPAALDRKAQLSAMLARDSRTGLALLPIALAEPHLFDAEQRQRFMAGLEQLVGDFERVLIDCGPQPLDHVGQALCTRSNTILVVSAGTDPTETALGDLGAVASKARLVRIGGAKKQIGTILNPRLSETNDNAAQAR